MGTRRYSLDRYSANREYRTVGVAESFAATLGTVAGPAIPVAFQERYTGTLRTAVRGTVSLISAFTGAVELHAAARPSVNLPVEKSGRRSYGSFRKSCSQGNFRNQHFCP